MEHAHRHFSQGRACEATGLMYVLALLSVSLCNSCKTRLQSCFVPSNLAREDTMPKVQPNQLRQRRMALAAILLLLAPGRLTAEPAQIIGWQDSPQAVSFNTTDPVIDGIRTKFLEFDAPVMSGVEISVSAAAGSPSVVRMERRLSSGDWVPVAGTSTDRGWSGSLTGSDTRYRMVIGFRVGTSDHFTVSGQLTPPARNRNRLGQLQSGYITPRSLRSGAMRMQVYHGSLIAKQSYRFEAQSADFPIVLIARFAKTGEEVRSASSGHAAVIEVQPRPDDDDVTLMVVSENGATGAFNLTFTGIKRPSA